VLYYGVFKLQIAIEQKEIHQLISRQEKESSMPIQHQKIFSIDSEIEHTNKQLKIVVQFIKLMENDEWYKNPLLSRLDLATELGISEGYFSHKINQEFGKSVTQIINEYRIAEAKQLLQDHTFN
jgi:AraC-like DNA-binding protein